MFLWLCVCPTCFSHLVFVPLYVSLTWCSSNSQLMCSAQCCPTWCFSHWMFVLFIVGPTHCLSLWCLYHSMCTWYPSNSQPMFSTQGQTNILDGAIFLISFLTSKSDGVYPGSPKNTFFSKIFWVLVPQIAPCLSDNTQILAVVSFW